MCMLTAGGVIRRSENRREKTSRGQPPLSGVREGRASVSGGREIFRTTGGLVAIGSL